MTVTFRKAELNIIATKKLKEAPGYTEGIFSLFLLRLIAPMTINISPLTFLMNTDVGSCAEG